MKEDTQRNKAQEEVARLFQQGESEEDIYKRLGEHGRSMIQEFRERNAKERHELHKKLISPSPPTDPKELARALRTFLSGSSN